MGPDLRSENSVFGTAGYADALLDALPDATSVLDRSGTIVAVNRVWRMFTIDNGGSPEKTGVGISYLDVCARSAADGCSDAAEVLAGLRAVLAGETVESEREYPCPSPVVGRWFTTKITPMGGPTGGAVVSHFNISRRKMSEEELAHRASHDPLTGLANRLLFNDRLTDALRARPGRPDRADVGLLYIDLDDFKPINDTYGHDAGDEVLLCVTHRLRSVVRPQDTVARLGGDEFAVCAPRITATGLIKMVDRIGAAIGQPNRIHGQKVCVGASVGRYLAGPRDTSAEALRSADQAMYAVKKARSERKVLAPVG
jgi:diguanylate cyclase (GGDEF)-like protein